MPTAGEDAEQALLHPPTA